MPGKWKSLKARNITDRFEGRKAEPKSETRSVQSLGRRANQKQERGEYERSNGGAYIDKINRRNIGTENDIRRKPFRQYLWWIMTRIDKKSNWSVRGLLKNDCTQIKTQNWRGATARSKKRGWDRRWNAFMEDKKGIEKGEKERP